MKDVIAQNGYESIAAGSKSFALASRLFAAELRAPVAELYAWCRYCDDAIDGQCFGHNRQQPNPLEQKKVLERLYHHTALAVEGKPIDDPVFQGLARVVRAHNIPPRYPRELLQGFEMDVNQRTYHNMDDLLEYSYHVAGVVGIMMARIMGVDDARVLDRASDLGLAFQLTNIARDLVEDARAGRVYVPASLLRRHGAPTDAASLSREPGWARAHGAVRDMLALADDYYHSARHGVGKLPFRCAWAVNAALKVYREIGEQLRRRGPRAWSGRVSVSTPRKVWLTASALPLNFSAGEQPRASELYCRPGR